MTDCYSFLGRTVWLAFLLYVLYKLCRFVYFNFFGTTFRWRPGPESWAIITGSTDGIGLEYGKQLANKGYNVLLISRTQSKLDSVTEIIKKDCPKVGQIETLAFDFTSTDYTKIVEKINSLEGRIDVLVNNVGISYLHPEYFAKLESSEIDNLINVNIISVTKMTHIVLPKMADVRKGVIINISSYAGSIPMPLLAVYSATKAYVDFFSRALQVEYAKKGLIIQSIMPAFVATAMSRMRPSITTPDPALFVGAALRTVGLEASTHAFWTHKIYGAITSIVNCIAPSEDFVSKISMKTLAKTRQKAYKKYNKKDD